MGIARKFWSNGVGGQENKWKCFMFKVLIDNISYKSWFNAIYRNLTLHYVLTADFLLKIKVYWWLWKIIVVTLIIIISPKRFRIILHFVVGQAFFFCGSVSSVFLRDKFKGRPRSKVHSVQKRRIGGKHWPISCVIVQKLDQAIYFRAHSRLIHRVPGKKEMTRDQNWIFFYSLLK